MITDFYFRGIQDPNYRDDLFASIDQIENTVSQVRMTLLTKKGEVLGEPEFGFDATKYLFEFEGGLNDEIESEIHKQIDDYVMMSKTYDIQATAFTLDSALDPFKAGLGLDVSINGRRSFAVLYDD